MGETAVASSCQCEASQARRPAQSAGTASGVGGAVGVGGNSLTWVTVGEGSGGAANVAGVDAAAVACSVGVGCCSGVESGGMGVAPESDEKHAAKRGTVNNKLKYTKNFSDFINCLLTVVSAKLSVVAGYKNLIWLEFKAPRVKFQVGSSMFRQRSPCDPVNIG